MKDYKTILLLLSNLFIIFWLIFILTPRLNITLENKNKIDELNSLILNAQKSQELLNNKIDSINTDVNKIDRDINVLKNKKTIVKEIYYEKINNINNFNETELDSFFTNRYK